LWRLRERHRNDYCRETAGVLEENHQSKDDPYTTFNSTKIIQTGPNSFDIPGTFTIRGASKPETLTFTAVGKGTGSGEIKGTMAFDRKEFGMNNGIPFIKIADRVEVKKKGTGPPKVAAPVPLERTTRHARAVNKFSNLSLRLPAS
jgi:hypothetical protein